MNPSLRAAVIAEWRGLPERKPRADRWQSPVELVPKLMQRLGLRERLHETEVIDAWGKIVGEFIAIAFSAGSIARRRSLCSCAPASVALRARTDFQVRDFAQTKTAFRWQDDSRRALSRGLNLTAKRRSAEGRSP